MQHSSGLRMYPCTVPEYLQWQSSTQVDWQTGRGDEGKNEPALHWTQPMRLD